MSKKLQDVRAATGNVSLMVGRSDDEVVWTIYTENRLTSVVLKRPGGRVEV